MREILRVSVDRTRLYAEAARERCLLTALTALLVRGAVALKIIHAICEQCESGTLSPSVRRRNSRSREIPGNVPPADDPALVRCVKMRRQRKTRPSVSKPGLTSRQDELDLVIGLTPTSTPYPLKPGIKRAVCLNGGH